MIVSGKSYFMFLIHVRKLLDENPTDIVFFELRTSRNLHQASSDPLSADQSDEFAVVKDLIDAGPVKSCSDDGADGRRN